MKKIVENYEYFINGQNETSLNFPYFREEFFLVKYSENLTQFVKDPHMSYIQRPCTLESRQRIKIYYYMYDSER